MKMELCVQPVTVLKQNQGKLSLPLVCCHRLVQFYSCSRLQAQLNSLHVSKCSFVSWLCCKFACNAMTLQMFFFSIFLKTEYLFSCLDAEGRQRGSMSL